MRPRKPRDYGHMHTTLENIVITQHSVKQGLRLFGEAGVRAVTDELKQLHNRIVLEPKGMDDMTRKQCSDTLCYLMFLKEKRCGRIKLLKNTLSMIKVS